MIIIKIIIIVTWLWSRMSTCTSGCRFRGTVVKPMIVIVIILLLPLSSLSSYFHCQCHHFHLCHHHNCYFHHCVQVQRHRRQTYDSDWSIGHHIIIIIIVIVEIFINFNSQFLLLLLLLRQKNLVGHILGTKRATGVPRMSKQPGKKHRTGLTARRARRTKSRVLKGLQLEVGARRAPRLLLSS